MLTKRLFLGCAFCATASLGAAAALAEGRVSTRTELRRVEFPRHTHPGVESAIVLDGELVLNVEGQPAQTYRRGDSFEVPAGAVHWGKGGASDCRVFATYVVEKDKPLASPA
jgi:hypothetical protein